MSKAEPKYTETEWKLISELRRDWDAFCDADPVEADFAERMEAAGYCELVPVDEAALQDPFAAERGIERGGTMWVLTSAGRALIATEAKTP